MLDALASLFDSPTFIPHGYCLEWTPGLLWADVISDSMIAASYFSIPFALWYFVRNRPDLPFRAVFLMFGLFVLACGATHLMDVRNIWAADYRLDAGLRLVTAIASVITAMTLWKLMPQALAIPSRSQLTKANRELEAEVARRREAEADLSRINTLLSRRSTELEIANRELDSFAYAVSHDLRAPLRAMSGFSQALMEDYENRLDGEAKLYLDQISQAGEHMGHLVDGLLTLSRSTRADVRRDVVDVSAQAALIRYEVERTEPARAVAWTIEPELTVTGDARLVEAIMRNLLGNAWKYTAHVAAPEIRVYSEDRDGSRWLCVTDNGAGFDMDHADRLFKPFQRLHRQDEFPGIGIGLATVQRIVHRHGGTIRAVGAVGRGATFSVFLPAADSDDDDDIPSPPATP